MLARSLRLLAGILILIKCIEGGGQHRLFGVRQWPLTDGESQEPQSPAITWLDIQIPYWLKPFRYTDWCHQFAHVLLQILGYSAAGHAEDLRDTRPLFSGNDSQVVHEIPQYVFDHAPLVHLYSEEKFWPCDIAEHLHHITPELNYTPIYPQAAILNLTNLDELNKWNEGRNIYLTSDDDVEEIPEWLSGQENIPDIPYALQGQFADNKKDFELPTAMRSDSNRRGSESIYVPPSKRRRTHSSPLGDTGLKTSQKLRRAHQPGGRSNAPAILICVNKGQGVVDAFWFFFYGFNRGNVVFNVRFGNHVGDWEHTLVRFQNGVPRYVFFSEHNFGSAYGYGAVEKNGKRPIAYSAVGTHAMYATPGAHPYILPLGILHDQTDRGPLWDPLLNSHIYTYNHLTDELRASKLTPSAPTEWFYFAGHWGDKVYPLSDSRQYQFAKQYHYVSGPLGPRFKNLGRRKVCQGHYSDPCVIKNWLAPNLLTYWEGAGDGEEEG